MKLKSTLAYSLGLISVLGIASCNNEPFPEGDPLFPTATTEITGQATYLAAPKANNIAMEAFFADYQYLGSTLSRGEAATFSIKLAEPAKAKTTVKLELVPAAEVMAAYEKIYGDKTGVVGVAPDGLFALENATVEIEAGKQEATATVVWGDKTPIENIKTDGKYLAGVRVASTTEGSLTQKFNTVFVGLKRSTLYYKPINDTNFSAFTKVPYTDLTAEPESIYGVTYGPSKAFDGRATTGWLTTEKLYTIDFNEDVALRGLRIAAIGGGFSYYSAQAVKISFYDANGNLLLGLAESELNSFTYKDGYYPFELYNTLTCRRVTLEVTKMRDNSLTGFGELEFYK